MNWPQAAGQPTLAADRIAGTRPSRGVKILAMGLPLHPSQQPQPGANDELVLVGFRIDAAQSGPHFYTLFAIGGANERPLVSAGRIIFFTRPEFAGQALTLDESMAGLGEAPQELEMVCDVAGVLYLVNSQDSDADGVVLECLHTFDDLVRATRLNMPEVYQKVLGDLAANMEATADLRNFFTTHSRETVEDALLWCVGAVTVRATVLG